MTKKHWTMILPGALLLGATPAGAVELKDAVQAALNSNPEIRQAVSNKAATREERIQAEGEYAPKLSVEASAGARTLRNPTRRAIGIAGEALYPVEGDANVDWTRAGAGPKSGGRPRGSTGPRPALMSDRNMSRSTCRAPTLIICSSSA